MERQVEAELSTPTSGSKGQRPQDRVHSYVLQLWAVLLQVFRWENEGIRGLALIERMTPEAIETAMESVSEGASKDVVLDAVHATSPFAGTIPFVYEDIGRHCWWCKTEITRLLMILQGRSCSKMAVAPAILTLPSTALAILVVPTVDLLDAYRYVVLEYSDPTRMTMSSFSTGVATKDFLVTLSSSPADDSTEAPIFTWMSSSSNLLNQDRKPLPSPVLPSRERPSRPGTPRPPLLLLPPLLEQPPRPLPILRAFDCAICLETHPGSRRISFRDCSHDFCQDCLKKHTQTTLEDGRFPVYCPCCMVETSSLSETPMVNIQMMDQMGLRNEDKQRWHKLSESKTHCQMECHRCSKSILVPKRRKATPLGAFICPTKGCRQLFCNKCLGSVKLVLIVGHVCSGVKELERTMKENGWQKCPGCGTPTENIAGCDRMTCKAFGCRTQWSYGSGRPLRRVPVLQRIGYWLDDHF